MLIPHKTLPVPSRPNPAVEAPRPWGTASIVTLLPPRVGDLHRASALLQDRLERAHSQGCAQRLLALSPLIPRQHWDRRPGV